MAIAAADLAALAAAKTLAPEPTERRDGYSKTLEYTRPDGTKVTESMNLNPTGIGLAATVAAGAVVGAVGVAAFYLGVIRPTYTVTDSADVFDKGGNYVGTLTFNQWEVVGPLHPALEEIGPPVDYNGKRAQGDDYYGPTRREIVQGLPVFGDPKAPTLSGPLGLVKVSV